MTRKMKTRNEKGRCRRGPGSYHLLVLGPKRPLTGALLWTLEHPVHTAEGSLVWHRRLQLVRVGCRVHGKQGRAAKDAVYKDALHA